MELSIHGRQLFLEHVLLEGGLLFNRPQFHFETEQVTIRGVGVLRGEPPMRSYVQQGKKYLQVDGPDYFPDVRCSLTFALSRYEALGYCARLPII